MGTRMKAGSTDPSDLAAVAAEAAATEELNFEAYGLGTEGPGGELLVKKSINDGEADEKKVDIDMDPQHGAVVTLSNGATIGKGWSLQPQSRKAVVIAPGPPPPVVGVEEQAVGGEGETAVVEEVGLDHRGVTRENVLGIDVGSNLRDVNVEKETQSVGPVKVKTKGQRNGTRVEGQGGKDGAAQLPAKRKRRQYKTEEERKKARILKNRRTAEESRQRRLKRMKELETIESSAKADRERFEEMERMYKAEIERFEEKERMYKAELERFEEKERMDQAELHRLSQKLAKFEQYGRGLSMLINTNTGGEAAYGSENVERGKEAPSNTLHTDR